VTTRLVRVTPKTTQAQIAAEIARLNGEAQACKQIVGNNEYLSPWDQVHRQINVLLCEWQLRKNTTELPGA
jgi:hypothetical protein